MGSNSTSFSVLEHPAPSFTTSEASELAKFWFKETLDVSPLVSERDQNFLLTNKKRAFRALFYCELSIKRKINHHKQDILVRPGWHRRIVPKH